MTHCFPASATHVRAGSFVVLLGVIGLFVSVQPARAQLSRVGATNIAGVTFTIRGNDVAYDPVDHVYLVVGAGGPVEAVLTTENGTAASGLIVLHSNVAQFAQFPRVVYSHDLNSGQGGFLVTWHQDDTGPPSDVNYVHTRIVSPTGTLVGTEHVVSTGAPNGTWWEAGAAVAYSATSQHFLVAWQTCCGGNSIVQGALIDLTGAAITSPLTISNGPYGRDPGVAWNPNTDEFGVSFDGQDSTAVFSAFARVRASDGTLLRRNVFNHESGGTFITDIAFNSGTGQFVMTWADGSAVNGAAINANGDVVAMGLISSRSSYDGMSVSYNPNSGTFLLLENASSQEPDEVFGAELNANGARFAPEIMLTSTGGAGTFYPRAAPDTTAMTWNLSASRNFNAILDQIVQTTATNGGPAGTLGSAPSGQTSGGGNTNTNTGGCTTVQPGAGWTCVNGGWLPPGSGGSTNTSTNTNTNTGGCTTVQPGSGWTCVNGGWLPPGSGGSNTNTNTNTGGCTTAQPGSGWTCVNGGWLPPGSGDSNTNTNTNTGGCTTVQPGSGWTCVNGGWLPPGSGGSNTNTNTNTGGCTTVQPGSGWTCVNGGWLPPGSGGSNTNTNTNTGGCTTAQPGSGWTCVNGGWLPPGSGGSNTNTNTNAGGCTTVQPGSGWTCVNGGWLPPGSGGSNTNTNTNTGGCTTAQPGSGWTCVNGGWLPPGISGGTNNTSSCTTIQPGQNWTCVNGGWLPPSSENLTHLPLSSDGGRAPSLMAEARIVAVAPPEPRALQAFSI